MVAGASDACFGPSGSGPVHRERVNAGGSVNQSGHMRAGDAPGHHTAPDIATEGTVRRDGSRVHHGRVARRVRMRHRIAELVTGHLHRHLLIRFAPLPLYSRPKSGDLNRTAVRTVP